MLIHGCCQDMAGLPTVSRMTDMGTMPSAADQQPELGLKPTTPVMLAGILQDPAAGKHTV